MCKSKETVKNLISKFENCQNSEDAFKKNQFFLNASNMGLVYFIYRSDL